MFSLHVKDHRLKEKDEVVEQPFTISHKTQREMFLLNRFDKNKRDKATVLNRTRRDLQNPADKELRDRLKQMQKSKKSMVKKRIQAEKKAALPAKKVTVFSKSIDSGVEKMESTAT